MSPAERLGVVAAAYVVLVGLLWLAGRGAVWAASVHQGRRLDQRPRQRDDDPDTAYEPPDATHWDYQAGGER